jgi:uncharacterized SAM-binding protein YcdF (DUF218 family)
MILIRPRFKPKHLIPAIFVGLILFSAIVFFRNAGHWLVKHDQPQQADAVVILMGAIAERVLEAHDIYQAGLANRMIIPENVFYGSEALENAGVSIPYGAQLSKEILVKLGVPDSLISIAPGKAASTYQEALSIADYLSRNPHLKTLILSSSEYHMRRAIIIFRHVAKAHGLDVEFVAMPSKYGDFRPGKWWRHRESAKHVFYEYTKLLYFLIVERWR